MSDATLIIGDCVEKMREMPANSVDAIVTDPPYLIGFMGKEFDSQHRTFVERRSVSRAGTFESVAGNHNPEDVRDRQRTLRSEGRKAQAWHEAWACEALRVLKPGGHLVAFSGQRTYHRLAAAVEDAGFEIRFMLGWCFGSGFPKSMDASKAIDKHFGKDDERQVVGIKKSGPLGGKKDGSIAGSATFRDDGWRSAPTNYETSSATPEATRWVGYGTALKPALEPIVLARKPLDGTVAENLLKWGVGALNIDRTRVGVSGGVARDWRTGHGVVALNTGRWPPNLLLGHSDGCVNVRTKKVGDRAEEVPKWRCVEGCPVRLMDEQSGERQGGAMPKTANVNGPLYQGGWKAVERPERIDLDSGTASRFFPQFQDQPDPFAYFPKASRSEREAGLTPCKCAKSVTNDVGACGTCGNLVSRNFAMSNGANNAIERGEGQYDDSDGAIGLNRVSKVLNTHPTVKPWPLMAWLCRLVTPPGGVVLDPFLGSGSTGIAARLEGFRFVGVEYDAGYMEIAKRRIAHWEAKPPKDTPHHGEVAYGKADVGDII